MILHISMNFEFIDNRPTTNIFGENIFDTTIDNLYMEDLVNELNNNIYL